MAVEKLSTDEIAKNLETLEGWEYDLKTDHIIKKYQFKGFYKTIAFVNCVAWYAQKHCHHPDLVVTFNTCEVRLTTHDAGGISQKDFDLARQLEVL